MDWAFAIDRNRQPLMRIIAGLFAMIGFMEGQPVERISSELKRAVLRVLRPAESAVRRLIVAAARGITVPLPFVRRAAVPHGQKAPRKSVAARVTFRLIDTRRRFSTDHLDGFAATRAEPRVSMGGGDPRVPAFLRPPAVTVSAASPPDETVDAHGLCNRLVAIRRALEDLPRQARRLVRWQARRAANPNGKALRAIRLGRAPGARAKPTQEVDHILKECQWLAWEALRFDSS